VSFDPVPSTPSSSASAAPGPPVAHTAREPAPLGAGRSLQIALLLGVTLLAYGNSLANGFTMDDELYILRNPQVTQPSIRLLFQPNSASNVFRPITFATLGLNWLAAGYQPFGYHLVNLLLHSGVVVLLFFVLRKVLDRLAGCELISLLAALLFAVHPIHTEAVSSVVGRSELLAAGFLFAAWLLHLHDRYVLALLGFTLALLSKESAIGLLLLVLAGDYARGKFKHRARYVSIAALTLLYIAALWKVQGGHFGPASVSVLDNPLTLLPAHLRILNAVRIAWNYVGLLIFPATLSCDYSYNQITLYSGLRHLLLPLFAAAGAMGLWAWAVARRSVALTLAGAVYFAGFAATSNIVTRTGTIFAERLAYLPSAGFCLLAAALFFWLLGLKRTGGIAVFALVATVLGVRTVVRNRDWRDNTSLYLSAGDAVPGSAKMRTFRGIIYLGRNDFELSRQDLEAALRINPEYPDAVEAMGLLESRIGNQTSALRYLEQALQMSSREDFDYDYRAANLATQQIQMGRLDDAMKLLNRSIEESPGYSRLWSNRAALRLLLGQVADARADARTALRLDANNLQARYVLERPQAGSLH
jgi:tetratricopeptide (TPR) repeat protein